MMLAADVRMGSNHAMSNLNLLKPTMVTATLLEWVVRIVLAPAWADHDEDIA